MAQAPKMHPVNLVRLCISSLQPFSGLICGTAVKDPVPFTGSREFIIAVGDVYDSIGQPVPIRVMRSFREDAPKYNSFKGSPERYHTADEIEAMCGEAKTVDMVMISQRNSEWQGYLKSPEGKVIGPFATALECMNLLIKE